jgi:histidinol-phosphate aminotransferase
MHFIAPEQKRGNTMNRKPVALSRRGFAQMLGAGAAFTVLRTALGASARVKPLPSPGITPGVVVRLSANENPYGPSPEALKAMKEAFSLAWRYPDEYADALVDELAKLHGIAREQILLGDGSGEILKVCAAALTGTGKRVVMGDPTFEAIMYYARVGGAEVTRVALASDYRHDLGKMLAASTDAGLVYICNPNNPTATVTPKQEVRAFLKDAPRSLSVLVDEAYYHYADGPEYESVIPLVKDYPNLIVARTFSKIYGMAGLRCGYAVAQSQLIERLRAQAVWDSLNIMALVAALASLRDTKHVGEGRRLNDEVKKYVYSELDKMGYRYLPSSANFMMIELRREVRPVLDALKANKVEVGRFFPALPNFMRVTIGTRSDMQTFLQVFRQVIQSNANA